MTSFENYKLSSTWLKKKIPIFCSKMIHLSLFSNLYSLYYYELYTYELKFMNYMTLYDYNL
jgi:hypothetical protein